jgi:hypothetical protein
LVLNLNAEFKRDWKRQAKRGKEMANDDEDLLGKVGRLTSEPRNTPEPALDQGQNSNLLPEHDPLGRELALPRVSTIESGDGALTPLSGNSHRSAKTISPRARIGC